MLTEKTRGREIAGRGRVGWRFRATETYLFVDSLLNVKSFRVYEPSLANEHHVTERAVPMQESTCARVRGERATRHVFSRMDEATSGDGYARDLRVIYTGEDNKKYQTTSKLNL